MVLCKSNDTLQKLTPIKHMGEVPPEGSGPAPWIPGQVPSDLVSRISDVSHYMHGYEWMNGSLTSTSIQIRTLGNISAVYIEKYTHISGSPTQTSPSAIVNLISGLVSPFNLLCKYGRVRSSSLAVK